MLTTNELLIFDRQNEHDSEHDLSKKKNYSVPKIYNANGDIKKRWYENTINFGFSTEPNFYILFLSFLF